MERLNTTEISNVKTMSNMTSQGRSRELPNEVAAGILLYGVPILGCIGVVGNLLAFAVALTKSMRKYSYSVYIAALAVADILNLYHFIVRHFFDNSLGYSSDWLSNNCYIKRWFTSGSQTAGAWLVIVMTTQRFLAIFWPLRSRQWFTVGRTMVAVFSVVILAYVIYVPALLSFQAGMCSGRRGPPGFVNWPLYVDVVYPVMNTITYSLGPSIVLIVENTAILVHLSMRARVAKRQHQTDTRSTAANKHREIGSLIITVSVLYACMTMPSMIYILYISQTGRSMYMFSQRYIGGAVSIVLVIANHSINIFVYLASSLFRNALVQSLRGRQTPHAQGSNMTDQTRIGSQLDSAL